MVYEETKPSNQRMIRMIAIVSSMFAARPLEFLTTALEPSIRRIHCPKNTVSAYAPARPVSPTRMQGAGWQRSVQGHLICMSSLTEVTPLTPRASSIALFAASRELTKPLN